MVTPARILVVEDDRIVSRDIQQQLRRIGYEVLGAATTGEGSVDIALGETPDIVLMDIRLEGEIDGIEAAERIRRACAAPVIFLTAYADDETVRRASNAEPFGYLMKPFDDQQLRTAIEIALYKHAAERRLRESERRYATTLESIGDGVIATDAKAFVSFMNPVAEALTGWTMADAKGVPVQEVFRIVNEDTRQTVEDPVAKVLRLGTIVGLANHTVLLARDGREIPIDDCGSPIIDDDGEISGVVLVFRDISQKREMDQALRQAEARLTLVSRLSQLGEFAAMVAHEVNQPLTAIVTNADTCLRYLDEARQAAERIVDNGHRAGNVVRSVRTLVGRSRQEISDVDVEALIHEVVELRRSEIRECEIILDLGLSTSLPPVSGDRVQLQQVVSNLIANAIDAMREVEGRQRRLTITAVAHDGEAVTVTVSDTGSGLASKPDEIFEPMFTTKPDGMGLGLSISRSIVEGHGGRIRVEPGEPGTRFVFTIPLRRDEL